MAIRYREKSSDGTIRVCPLCGKTFKANNGFQYFLKPDGCDPLPICIVCIGNTDVKDISVKLFNRAVDVSIKNQIFKMFYVAEKMHASFENGDLKVLKKGEV